MKRMKNTQILSDKYTAYIGADNYELGKASYLAPEGMITGEITNKRQFTIKDGKLIRVFDNNINIDDELLQEVLTEESNDKMKNIVNTI